MAKRSLGAGLPALVAIGLLGTAPQPNESPSQSDGSAVSQPPPDAVRDSWAKLIGTWIADNSAYAERGSADAFGMEWTWGVGETSLRGRLYGIKDGVEIGDYWEFREYWHPGARKVLVMQFGAGGRYGEGTHGARVDGKGEMVQTFYDPVSGSISRVGHRDTLSGDEHTTHSFDVTDAGEWVPRRSYVWRKQR